MSAAEEFFKLVCDRPGMYGPPDQVEACLWSAMFIWRMEHLGGDKNLVHAAVMAERKNVPELTDRAGLSFHHLCKNKLDYSPIIGPMTAAFESLRKLREDHAV